MDVKYGAISILLTARFRNESIPLDTVYSKIECEKLHIKFCKRWFLQKKKFFRAIIGSLLIMEKKIQDFQDDANIQAFV
jgi:hypothetical protein